jgi:hypothetical protein
MTTDDELESQLRDHYRSIDPGQPPTRLSQQVAEALEERPAVSRREIRFRPALGIGVGVVLLALLATAVVALRPQTTGVASLSPSPGSASSASIAASSPSPLATSQYQLGLLEGNGSSRPLISVTAAADCQPMPTDWLRQFCALTLRSDWRTIISPTDPFAPPPNATSSVTFLASVARAEISGDTTLCSDVAMREWLSASPGGQGPPPGETIPPKRPIADCIEILRETAAKGSFTVTDPDNEHAVNLLVDPGAADRAGAASQPAADPIVACLPGLTRNACDVLIDAVTSDAGSRASSWEVLRASGPDTTCDPSRSTCPPAAGISLGTVQVGLRGGGHALFQVVEINGQIKTIDLGSAGGVPATIQSTVETLGDPHITLYPPGGTAPAISSGTAYQVCLTGVAACLPEPPTAITLARVTDTAYGTASPSGTVLLTLNKTLVWTISWIGSGQCVFSGGGTGPRPSAPTVQPLCDQFAFVDATNGKFIFTSSFAHQ